MMVQLRFRIWGHTLPMQGAVGKFQCLLWFLLHPRVSFPCCLGSILQDFVWFSSNTLWHIFHDAWSSLLTFEQNKTILVYGCSFKEESKMYGLSINLQHFGYLLSTIIYISWRGIHWEYRITCYIVVGDVTWDIDSVVGTLLHLSGKLLALAGGPWELEETKFLSCTAVSTLASFVVIFCPLYRSRYWKTWRSRYFWDYWSGKGIVKQCITSFSGKTKSNSETSKLPH